MTAWTDGELRRVGDAVELKLASCALAVSCGRTRRCGSSGSATTCTSVPPAARTGSGTHHAVAAGTGRIRAGGIEQDVAFADADPGVHDAIDRTYHAKYDRFGPGPVSHVTGPADHTVTIRLVRP